jgi:hypothetical protein
LILGKFFLVQGRGGLWWLLLGVLLWEDVQCVWIE